MASISHWSPTTFWLLGLLSLVGTILLLRAALALGRRATRRRPPQARLTVLPDGHQPPVGLGPISPSERALVVESTRGLRDLQLFLLDQGTAA